MRKTADLWVHRCIPAIIKTNTDDLGGEKRNIQIYMIKIAQCVSYFLVWTSKWTKMTANCDVLTLCVIKIWGRISHQSNERPKPKQSVPTQCCLKVSPNTCVYKHSDARIWFGFEGTGTNGFWWLTSCLGSLITDTLVISSRKKVHFTASCVSTKKRKRWREG